MTNIDRALRAPVFVVPAQAVDQLAQHALETGTCVHVAKLTAQRRTERELNRLMAGQPARPQGREDSLRKARRAEESGRA